MLQSQVQLPAPSCWFEQVVIERPGRQLQCSHAAVCWQINRHHPCYEIQLPWLQSFSSCSCCYDWKVEEISSEASCYCSSHPFLSPSEAFERDLVIRGSRDIHQVLPLLLS
jgi:hypothetical protein